MGSSTGVRFKHLLSNKIFLTSLLSVALLGTLAGRAPLLFQNYPYLNYVDEGHVVRWAMDMYREGSLRPLSFHYNPVLQELIAVGAWFQKDSLAPVKLIWSQRLLGNYTENDFERYYGSVDPPEFMGIGRVIVFSFFALSVFGIWLTIAQILPVQFAAFGAVLFSTVPVLIAYSVYIVNDIPIMAAGSFLYCLSLREQRSRYLPILAGALIGLAIGFKTSGVLLFGFPAVLFVLNKDWRGLIVTGLSTLFFFYLFSPGMLGEERGILENLRWQLTSNTPSSSSHFMQLISLNKIGFPLVLCSLWGIYVGVKSSDERLRRVSIAGGVYCLAYLLLIMRNSFQPDRYLLPLLPLFVLFSTVGIHQLFRSRPRSVVAAIVALSILSSQSYFSYREFRKVSSRVDTRIELLSWFEENLSPGDTVSIWDAIAFSPSHMRRLERESGVRFKRFVDPREAQTADYLVSGDAGDSGTLVFRVGKSKIDPSPYLYPQANRKIVVRKMN
jgi:hypothetical protein